MKSSLRVTLTALLAGACGFIAVSANAAGKSYTPATPEPGTDIPQVPVKFGMRPYADNTYFVVGMEKGWFKDVGIEITPPPYGLKTTEAQWVTLLLNHQVDIDSATCSALLPSYKTTDVLKCAGFAVTFYGEVHAGQSQAEAEDPRRLCEGGRSVRRRVEEGADAADG